jgi:N-methylhydantoinase A/oxoprolinase/acetone carboxylase beta subunit
MRIGIDTGGTFTDLVLWDGHRCSTHKIRSTPNDPARAILQGLRELLPGGQTAAEIVHGSTVATNALLENKGARTAFVTTEGFEDLLVIGRQNRRELYNFFAPAKPRLVPTELTFGLPERMLHDGSIQGPLDPAAAQELARQLFATGVESVAVCLLHSYANGAHERSLAQELKKCADSLGREPLFVSLSHEVLPEYREYERATTTLVNAYVSPLMGRYLLRLAEELGKTRLRVFQSNGGSISAAVAGRNAVHTVLSGPAGGVLGAVAAARAAGFERIIGFDMGGTSTDVSLYDGRFTYTTETTLGDFPIRVPMLDIHSVGAGGGSVAWLDSAGALRVGPHSAGAQPGPVCYGEGEQVTVTDANLVLGRIDPARFLGGRMQLDLERCRHYMARFAATLGVSPEQAARAIVNVANSNMERAIRVVSVERGHDPREFALLSFGGAGAQHACELAERLEIPAVIVPRHAGVLSALGMLAADCVRDYSQSVLTKPAGPVFADLETRAAEELAGQGFTEVVLERHIDLRYRGQSYEITVPWEKRATFHELHRRLYGYDHREREVEQVTARVKATGVLPSSEKIDVAAPSDRQEFSSVYVPKGWKNAEDEAGNVILRATR